MGQCVGAHSTLEILAPANLELTPEHVLLDDLTGEQAGELIPRPVQDVEFLFELVANELKILLSHLGPCLEVRLLDPLSLHLGQLGLEVLLPTVQLAVALLLDGEALLNQFGLQLGQILLAFVLVHPHHHVGGEVDDLLQLLGLELLARLGAHEQVGQP